MLLVAVVLMLSLSAATMAGNVTVLQGTLSLLGNEPFTFMQLQTDRGELYRISGQLADELREVGQGYVVKVAGTIGPAAPPLDGTLEVYQYKIVALQSPGGDKKPFVGRVVVDSDDTYLISDDLTVYLLQGIAVHGLREMPGARLCVVGKTSRSRTKIKTLTVAFYNVIKN